MSTQPRTRQTRRTTTGAAPEEAPTGSVVKVTMYDVGFGDCFLVRIPTRDGERKMLFDCGSIKGGSLSMEQVRQQVIEDARPAPGAAARIDVVVATHRHKDHISGFDSPAWVDVEVGEVWMPWTENPRDEQGRQIRERQSRLASLLADQLGSRLAAVADPAERARLEGVHALALNALSNEGAMRTLQRGFANRPLRRYLPDQNAATPWFETPLLPGVTIHVLGPSRDPQVILDLDPPAGQSYLKMAESSQDGDGAFPYPFGVDWGVESALYASQFPNLSYLLGEADRERVRQVGLGFDEAVAATLDKALNGTSLMLVLQVGDLNLLFPGDAQWGTWRMALEDPESRKLLDETHFYKVGHHGSHNATPVDFVDKLLDKGIWAMVSTNSMAQWPEIPKAELMTALEEKSEKIARSDQPKTAKKAYFTLVRKGVIETRIPV